MGNVSGTSPVSRAGIAKPRQDPEARRKHILEATARCVRRSGFHGASMADIAAEAKLSVGIIYRYFANKEAIIEAIVAADLADLRAKFAEFAGVPDDKVLDTLLDGLEQALEHKYTPDTAALAIEVLAEAARNPRVAAMVADADAQERELGRGLCRRLCDPLTPGSIPVDIDARSEILAAMFDGVMMRVISNPGLDRAALVKGMRYIMRQMLTLPAIPEA